MLQQIHFVSLPVLIAIVKYLFVIGIRYFRWVDLATVWLYIMILVCYLWHYGKKSDGYLLWICSHSRNKRRVISYIDVLMHEMYVHIILAAPKKMRK